MQLLLQQAFDPITTQFSSEEQIRIFISLLGDVGSKRAMRLLNRNYRSNLGLRSRKGYASFFDLLEVIIWLELNKISDARVPGSLLTAQISDDFSIIWEYRRYPESKQQIADAMSSALSLDFDDASKHLLSGCLANKILLLLKFCSHIQNGNLL